MKFLYCSASDKESRQLAVLFAWMSAKDKHLVKYQKLYINRGFDVLTVTTEPLQLLFPEKGAQPIARAVLEFLLSDQVVNYQAIIVHAFSVGCYQFSEVLVEMERDKEVVARMSKVIKGVVLDSGPDINVIGEAMSNIMTKNSLAQMLIKNYINLHLSLFHRISTQHYIRACQALEDNAIRCPVLIMVSNADRIGRPENSRRFVNAWLQNGVHVQWKCFDNSGHVAHYYKYPEQYEQEIDKFLIKML